MPREIQMIILGQTEECLIWFYAPGLMGEGLGKTKKEKDKKTE